MTEKLDSETLAKVDVKERTIFINEGISSKSIEEAILAIRKINQHDDTQEDKLKQYTRKPIHLIVDSYGGYVNDGFGLINMITSSKTPVHTYCYSKAMSMGFLIFISGHKRFVHEHASLMYHQISGFTYGTNQEMIEQVEANKDLMKHIKQLVFKRTNITKKQLKKNSEKKQDWYIYGKKAVKLGVADELIKDTI